MLKLRLYIYIRAFKKICLELGEPPALGGPSGPPALVGGPLDFVHPCPTVVTPLWIDLETVEYLRGIKKYSSLLKYYVKIWVNVTNMLPWVVFEDICRPFICRLPAHGWGTTNEGGAPGNMQFNISILTTLILCKIITYNIYNYSVSSVSSWRSG